MHNEIFEHTTKIYFMSQRLVELGNAFSLTGNTRIADDIWSIADTLYDSQKAINNAVSKEIQDRCKESEQASTNMLEACLSGILIGKE